MYICIINDWLSLSLSFKKEKEYAYTWWKSRFRLSILLPPCRQSLLVFFSQESTEGTCNLEKCDHVSLHEKSNVIPAGHASQFTWCTSDEMHSALNVSRQPFRKRNKSSRRVAPRPLFSPDGFLDAGVGVGVGDVGVDGEMLRNKVSNRIANPPANTPDIGPPVCSDRKCLYRRPGRDRWGPIFFRPSCAVCNTHRIDKEESTREIWRRVRGGRGEIANMNLQRTRTLTRRRIYLRNYSATRIRIQVQNEKTTIPQWINEKHDRYREHLRVRYVYSIFVRVIGH